ncbi:MAG: ribose-phosphate diphosphokinase, partial [Burkholderiaceae bacterium]
DDLISTGNTIIRTAKSCQSLGAARVFAAATHGLFTGDANAVLADPILERIVVTDSVPPFRVNDGAVKLKLIVLSTTALFAEAIHRLHAGGSIVELLE